MGRLVLVHDLASDRLVTEGYASVIPPAMSAA